MKITWPTDGFIRGAAAFLMLNGAGESFRDATNDSVQTAWDIMWFVLFLALLILYVWMDQREARGDGPTVTVKKKDLKMLYECAESYDIRIPANGHDAWAADIRKKLGKS